MVIVMGRAIGMVMVKVKAGVRARGIGSWERD